MKNPIYSNALIYKIESANGDKCYIGSTSKTMDERIARHQSNYRSYLLGRYSYTSSFEIIQDLGYICNVIQKFTNITRDELHRLEGEYTKQEKYCINSNIAGSLKLLGRQAYTKKNYNDNKPKLMIKHKCPQCNGSYTYFNKKRHNETIKHIFALEKKISKLKIILLKELKKHHSAKRINSQKKHIRL